MEQTIQTTRPLVPNWTEDDFYSDAVYQWLWEHREDNKYIFQQYLQNAQRRAKALHVIGFMKTWNAFVQTMNPQVSTVMGHNVTMFPDQPTQLECGRYECTTSGVSYTGRMGEDVEVIRHPIMPVSRITNIDSGEEQMQIVFNRGADKKWHSVIVPKETLASAQRIITLAKNGIAVNSENAREVVKYLSDLESMNYDELTVQQSTSHMGWTPDGNFVPYSGELIYDGNSAEYQRMFTQFKPHGSRDKWMELAKSVRAGKSIPARIALAASFSAPLVQLMGGLPFFCHFWGLQGSGKTVALKLAASVWGNPELGGYIKSFSGTKVSQELNAAFFCNLPVFLDELQVISDRKSFDDIIYMLCEGFSKGRGSKEGGLQAQRRWATCFLTTGEMPIVQSNSGGGAAVRTIEINYGGEPFFNDARVVAQTVDENYGHIGPEFIAALKEEGAKTALKELQESFYAALSGDIEAKQVLSASIILAADAFATNAIFKDGKALTPNDIRPYLITHDQADMNLRCYQWLIGYIAGNPKRFEIDDNNGELWGIKGTDEITGKRILYFIRKCFDDALHAGGFSPGAFLAWAKQRGYIKTTRNDNNTMQKRINGERVLCVALFLPGKDDEFTEVTDDTLPF